MTSRQRMALLPEPSGGGGEGQSVGGRPAVRRCSAGGRVGPVGRAVQTAVQCMRMPLGPTETSNRDVHLQSRVFAARRLSSRHRLRCSSSQSAATGSVATDSCCIRQRYRNHLFFQFQRLLIKRGRLL